jgi:RNA polymerase sigma-70 factor, ECF subfamily
MVMAPRNGSPAPCRQQLVVLMGDVSRGDRAAFERLYAATSAKLYGIVLRIVRRRDVADELLQEVYLRIWQHRAQFDARRSSPISWMATIARNRALDEVKRVALPLIEIDLDLLDGAIEDGLLTRNAGAEEVRGLHVCLERLEPAKSALVVQAYGYGMSRKEIARITGRPVSTIKTWLRRTLTELRSEMVKEDLLAAFVDKRVAES